MIYKTSKRKEPDYNTPFANISEEDIHNRLQKLMKKLTMARMYAYNDLAQVLMPYVTELQNELQEREYIRQFYEINDMIPAVIHSDPEFSANKIKSEKEKIAKKKKKEINPEDDPFDPFSKMSDDKL